MSDVADLVVSPRFIEACRRYGLKDEKVLLPGGVNPTATKNKERPMPPSVGGVEASLYAMQEKRRLRDLSCVLHERQKILNEAASSTRAAGAKGVDGSGAPAHDVGVEEAPTLPVDAVKQHASDWVEQERRRTCDELIEIVKSDAVKTTLREKELERQANIAAAEKQQRIEADLRRRASMRNFHATRDANRERMIREEEEEINRTREKMTRQLSASREQLEGQQALANKSFQLRRHFSTLESFDRQQHVKKVHEAVEASVKTKYEERRHRGQRPRTASSLGRVISVMEGPKGENIRRVKARADAEQAARKQHFEIKLAEDREKRIVNEKMREVAQLMKQEASRQRLLHQQQHLSNIRSADGAHRQSVMDRLDQGVRGTEAMEARKEKGIKEKRLLAYHSDVEKEQCVARAAAARDYQLKLVNDEAAARNGRIQGKKNDQNSFAAASRRKAEGIHYTRERIKDAVVLAPVTSLKSLGREGKVLKSLGLDMADLEAASLEAKQKTLMISRSTPVLRPLTAPPRT